MPRWLMLLLLPVLLAGLAACGGGDDDDDGGDDSSDDSSNDDSSGDEREDSSDGSGTLTVASKEYKLDMETCILGKNEELTVISARLEGESDADFSASGLGNKAAIAMRFGNQGYIAVAEEMKIDGKKVSWDGDAIDPQDPGKKVKAKFSLTC